MKKISLFITWVMVLLISSSGIYAQTGSRANGFSKNQDSKTEYANTKQKIIDITSRDVKENYLFTESQNSPYKPTWNYNLLKFRTCKNLKKP